MAVSETRRSLSTWSLENATAKGYRQNCNNEMTKPIPNSNSSGTLGSIASGAEATARPTAALRISNARS
ncbi:hypothetical protein D3C80_2211320 [compost metagenome]